MASQQCGNSSCTKGAASAALKACSRCRKVGYCSRECQTVAWTTHKTSCRRQNYIVKFHLSPGNITNPEVVRTLSCPADTSLYHLHVALQVAFGWATTHSFDFAVKDPSYREPDNVMDVIKRKMLM
ncbi:mynd domain containing protein [Grosmannia clavigera kw1407]|uniref:Mynd domain containing protein n=1 Tax=Grosmannia clavigera (strain kw1407 / UAMH 11150) TaxID=655863 RepID=F0XEV3_GROCL|nr:mynd domain containing protein [Grosmannia clavigera kw1407]EFX04015.1 mynd domain containing protein [Grosmannia clavigera kw1407]